MERLNKIMVEMIKFLINIHLIIIILLILIILEGL